METWYISEQRFPFNCNTAVYQCNSITLGRGSQSITKETEAEGKSRTKLGGVGWSLEMQRRIQFWKLRSWSWVPAQMSWERQLLPFSLLLSQQKSGHLQSLPALLSWNKKYMVVCYFCIPGRCFSLPSPKWNHWVYRRCGNPTHKASALWLPRFYVRAPRCFCLGNPLSSLPYQAAEFLVHLFKPKDIDLRLLLGNCNKIQEKWGMWEKKEVFHLEHTSQWVSKQAASREMVRNICEKQEQDHQITMRSVLIKTRTTTGPQQGQCALGAGRRVSVLTEKNLQWSSQNAFYSK